MLDKYFKLQEHKTSVGVEIAAGLTTFLTMAYILVVNPSILSSAGMPQGAVFTATALSVVIATALMGLYANMPFALAPGMGVNAFFTFVVVMGKGYTWNEALTAVFFSGILFLLLSVTGFREALVDSIPSGLKSAIGVAIGLMIASIGLKNAGIIKLGAVFLELGEIKTGTSLVALIGIVVTGIFMALRVKGGMLIGIALTAVIGIFIIDPATGTPVTNYARLAADGPFSMPPSLTPTFFAFSFEASRILTLDFLIIVFTLLFVDVFDSLGTFVGVLTRIGTNIDQYNRRIPKALLTDAIGTIAGACLGTSTVTTYVESSAGVAVGGRTGLTALVTGIAFAAALFFSNVFMIVPAAATTAALVIVGMFLAAASVKIDFDDFATGISAVLTILVTTLTWSISDGLIFGWLSFVLIKLLSGKMKDLNAITMIIAVIFLLKVVFL